MESLSSIESQYPHAAIPGIAKVVAGQGNLPKIHITTAQAEAEIYLHGAQVTAWRPAGAVETIFLSEQSGWEDGRAIRGGIPVCFPWFRNKSDNAKAPSHGVVRTKTWKLDSLTYDQGVVIATLSTESDEATRKFWPHDFRLVHRITVGTRLKLELIATNTGLSSFQFAEALHTYHHVGDATRAHVRGLDGATFFDNTDSNQKKTQQGDIVLNKATDNAYLDTTSAIELIDPVLQRRIRLIKENSASTVVWNPWEAGAKSLADMGDDEWRQMVCVEACNILHCGVTLEAGAQHTMVANIEVLP